MSPYQANVQGVTGRWMSTLLQIIAGLLCAAIAIYGFKVLTGFDPVLHLVKINPLRVPFLAIHIVGAATALLIMPLQLVPVVRRRWPAVHRWFGRVYVLACIVGAIGGFMLALGAVAGLILNIGFAALAIAWLATTLLGWKAARERRFLDHRAWMIRSFSLTFAAVTLRLYIPLSFALHLPFIPSYQAIAYLCWIPNLIVAELVLRYSSVSRVGSTSGAPATSTIAHSA